MFSAYLKSGLFVETKLATGNLKIADSARTRKTYHFANPGFCTNRLTNLAAISPQRIHQAVSQRVTSPVPVGHGQTRNDSTQSLMLSLIRC